MIDYKYDESRIINEIKAYVDDTYNGEIPVTESIIDDGHGTGFCMGNISKYSRRYGKSGETPQEWRENLMRVIQYSIIQLYIHDKTYGVEQIIPSFDVYGGDADLATINVSELDDYLNVNSISFSDSIDMDLYLEGKI